MSSVVRIDHYVPRLVDAVLSDLHDAFAAVQVVGPRACGKTTTAALHAAQVDRLDEPATAGIYRLDPDAALRRAARPLVIDEFQLVPEVRAAVKRAVDADPTPGQFILTGSARAGLDLEFEAGTGRIITLRMQGLVEREIEGHLAKAALMPETFVERLLRSGLDEMRVPARPPSIDDYLHRALRSGFPEAALRLNDSRQRGRWLNSYLDNVVTRDAELAGEMKDPSKLRAYLEVLALSTAGRPAHATLYGTAGINQRTATGYDGLLQNLYLVEFVPAWPWTGNRLTHLAKAPKRYVLDPGIAAAAAALTFDDVVHDPDLVGRLFETFGTAQLRAELELSDPAPRMHHLRTSKGRVEVDLVLDMGRRRAVGFEFKAGAGVTRADARHLLALRDDLGEGFLAGAVLYSGRHLVELEDRVYGIPLCCVWA